MFFDHVGDFPLTSVVCIKVRFNGRLLVLSNNVKPNLHTNAFLFEILIKTFIKYILVYFDVGFIMHTGAIRKSDPDKHPLVNVNIFFRPVVILKKQAVVLQYLSGLQCLYKYLSVHSSSVCLFVNSHLFALTTFENC